MPKRMLPLTLVQKRRGILEAKNTSNRPVVHLISHALNEASSDGGSKNSLREFFQKCTKDNANNYYKHALTMLESCDGKDKKLSKTLVHLFIENGVPYIEDLNELSKVLESFNFDGIDLIKESVTEYKIADRINRNHDMISKRFNIKKFVTENKNMGLRSLTEEVCRLIDTYNLPDYAKLNIALEECYYLFESVYPEYNHRNTLSSIVDYFLLREDTLPRKTLDQYKRTIENSRVIPKRARSSVSFLFESDVVPESKDVKELINQFKKDEKKDSGKLENIVTKMFSNKPENIIDDMPNVLGLLRTVLSIGVIAIQPIVGILLLIANKAANVFTEAKQSEKMVKYFIKEKENIEKEIENTKNESKLQDLRKYRDCLEKCIEKLEDHHRDITGGVDIESEEESAYIGKYYTLEEFKLFKHQNLINAAINSNKALELNYHRMRKEAREKNYNMKAKLHHLVTPTPEEKAEMDYENKFSTKFDKFVLGKEIPPYNFAGISLDSIHFESATNPDANIVALVNDMDEMDIVFSAIEFDNPDDAIEITKQFTPIIKNINQKISKDGLHAYGISTDLALEFHIATNDKVLLTEEQKELREHVFSPRDMFYISYIQTLCEQFLESSKIILENEDTFDKVSDKINPKVYFERACILMELYALSPKCKTKDTLNEMIKYYCEGSENKYYKYDKLHYLCDSLVSKKLSLQESAEVFNIANTILDEASNTSLNSAKLAMIKLKKDITKVNSNVREGIHNMEIAFNGVTRAIEKTLTTDKREEVLKGSLIPSFGKVMKLALVTCAAWAINPVVGIIVAVGTLGASKALNYREREMILDEIEIELKVVNREIERCGDSANPEKYRTLVQYQRRLERERHRIKMAMSTKGRRVPNVEMNRKEDE